MSRQRERPGPAAVVTVEPALLDEDRAAEFLSRSRAWLRAKRQEDHARAARGEAPVGPPFVSLDKSIFYRPADLRAWVDDRAVLRGKISFDKRAPAPATPEDA